MSFKEKLITAANRMPVVSDIIHTPRVRQVLENLPGFRALYSGWYRVHPFDQVHGTNTSGFLSPGEAKIDRVSEHNFGYGGSQPGVIRAVLKFLPPLNSFAFIDIGSGKARPALVATEYPFREIIGIELSTELAEIAEANAEKMALRYPERTAVRVLQADATTYQFPPGNLVVFMYNPFGAELMRKVVANLETALATGGRTIYVIYNTPLHGVVIDSSPAFQRFYAANVPYAREERGYGPDIVDAIAIWQAGAATKPHANANGKIVVKGGAGKAFIEA